MVLSLSALTVQGSSPGPLDGGQGTGPALRRDRGDAAATVILAATGWFMSRYAEAVSVNPAPPC